MWTDRTSRFLLTLALPLSLAATASRAKEAGRYKTFCNPINLEYRFHLEEPSRREAGDPTIVLYQSEYYLFASKSGGYWHSKDLNNWSLVEIADGVLPIEDYAPTALVMDGALYFTAQGSAAIYKSTNPKAGQWEKVAKVPFYLDPDLFLDDDGRLYLYYGGSPRDPLYAVELDKKSFRPIGKPVDTVRADVPRRGWEQSGPAKWPFTRFPDTHVSAGGPVTLNCLNAGVDYYFTIDAFNDSGLTKGKRIQPGLARRTDADKNLR